MGKSLGNFITLDQFFTGQHEKLTQAYSPMTIRFFILQAQYRSTVDFGNEALQASEKGLTRLMDAYIALKKLQPVADGKLPIQMAEKLREQCYEAMNDDLNTPIVISKLFDACRIINQLADGKQTITPEALAHIQETFHTFLFDILGLIEPATTGTAGGSSAEREEAFGEVVDMVLKMRAEAKAAKDWAKSDAIRDQLAALGFEVKDGKDGATWKLNK